MDTSSYNTIKFNKLYNLNEIIYAYKNNVFDSLCLLYNKSDLVTLLNAENNDTLLQENSEGVQIDGSTDIGLY